MISKAHEKRLQYFAEAASAYFWEVDADLRFTYFSPRALDILGYPPEHFIGKSLEEAGIRKDIGDADWRRQVEVLEARQPFRNLVVPRKRPDGATIYVSISGVPVLDDSGRFEGYCGTTSDVTERYRAEEEIRVAQVS
jgi:two-component system cell cycle sensor histidine kinase PleC